jgi:tRNA pseudouridine55 synthase
VVVVDKEAGVTSHDVVDRLRRRFGERRIGHAGTLDPPATGVLVCGVGRATRLLPFVAGATKAYTGEIVLGIATTTLDDTGEVVARVPMDVGPDEIRAAAAALTGEIEQVPPMVSAVRVAGRRLHELAREGQEVERDPRPVMVHRFDVEPTADPAVWQAVVECSSGTYVRSLAADLGGSLGGVAHLRRLRRTAVGSFIAAEAQPVDVAPLAPVETAVRNLPRIDVDETTAGRVGHGAQLDPSLMAGSPPWAVFGPDGALLAVYEPHRDATKPVVVLNAS